MNFLLYEGISIDNNGKVLFNYNKDTQDDILYLITDTSNSFNDNNVRCVYAYKYALIAKKDEKKVLRDFLKNNPFDKDVEEFVENGILKLDHIQSLETFGALVNIRPTKSTSLVNVIGNYLRSYMNPPFVSFELIKQTYDKVTFKK